MDHYENAFGTDWGQLDREDVLARAFALGVAAACGERNPEELDRLVDEVDTTYDRSMVELAYHEGERKGGSLRPELDDDAAVWAALVDDEDAPAVGVEAESDEEREDDRDDADGGQSPPAPGSERPSALSRASLLDGRTPDDRGALRLPEFLGRD